MQFVMKTCPAESRPALADWFIHCDVRCSHNVRHNQLTAGYQNVIRKSRNTSPYLALTITQQRIRLQWAKKLEQPHMMKIFTAL